MAAVSESADVYTSTDEGATWLTDREDPPSSTASSVALSGSGNRPLGVALLGCIGDGKFMVSQASGPLRAVELSAPSAQLAALVWAADSDCTAGESCSVASASCTGGPCSSHADCRTGQTCNGGTCR